MLQLAIVINKAEPVSSTTYPSLAGADYESFFPFPSAEYELHRSIVDNLLYLSIKARTNLSVAARVLACNVRATTEFRMPDDNYIYWYLTGTVDQVMMMRPGKDVQLTAFVEAS